MNNGEYFDATGDQCSHQFAYATKLNQAVKLLEGKAEFAGLLSSIKSNLDGAIVSGQSIECEQDFEALKIQ